MTPEQEAKRAAARAAWEAKQPLLLQAAIEAHEWLNERLDDHSHGPIDYRDAVLVVPAWQGEMLAELMHLGRAEDRAFEVFLEVTDELIAGGDVIVKRRGTFVEDEEWVVVGSGHGVFLDRIRRLKRLAETGDAA